MGISIDKKSRVCFLEKDKLLDKNLNVAKYSKNDTIIATINSNSLIKTQIQTTRDSFPPSNASLQDWLYAECIKSGIFKTDKNYILAYLCEESPNGQVFKLYALPEDSMGTAKIIIPDVFLPMALEEIKENSYLFLFEEEMAFYHHRKLAYHIAFQNPNDIIKTIEYISLVYGITLQTLYTLPNMNSKDLNLPISITPITSIQSHYPLAELAFDYFVKSQHLSLPILAKKEAFCIKNSLAFKWLLKIACVVFLISLYPLGEYFQGVYFKNKFETLRDKNLDLLQEISSLKQTSTLSNTKEIFQTLYLAQASYIPRYKLIADLSNQLWEKEIFVKELHFNSDVSENNFAFIIDILSLSQSKIIDFIDAFKNHLPGNQSISSDTFNQEDDKVSTQIIWMSNAL